MGHGTVSKDVLLTAVMCLDKAKFVLLICSTF